MRMTGRGFARRHSQARGQALVEFVLVAPIMLMLIFGVLDLGRYIYIRGTLEANAVQAVRSISLLENRSTDCPALQITSTTDNTLNVVVDSHSYWNNPQPASSPPPNGGYIYIDPAVAPNPPSLTNCSSATNLRPTARQTGGCTICADTVTINYSFVPWTPVLSNFFSNATLTAAASAQSEY